MEIMNTLFFDEQILPEVEITRYGTCRNTDKQQDKDLN